MGSGGRGRNAPPSPGCPRRFAARACRGGRPERRAPPRTPPTAPTGPQGSDSLKGIAFIGRLRPPCGAHCAPQKPAQGDSVAPGRGCVGVRGFGGRGHNAPPSPGCPRRFAARACRGGRPERRAPPRTPPTAPTGPQGSDSLQGIAQTVEKPPESSRGSQPSRTSNRAQRRVRWARDDFYAGKSHFPEQKPFPCSFCARKSLRFQQKLVRVAGRLKTLWVFRFRLWRNCRRLKS